MGVDMNKVKNSIKVMVRMPSVFIHRTAGHLFPALKCYFVRSVHRHMRLSNLLRKLVGKPPLDAPRYEECSPLFACLAADCRLNFERVIKFGVNKAKRHPALYQWAKGVLYRFPRLSCAVRRVCHQATIHVEQAPLSDAPGKEQSIPRHPGTSYEETLFLQLKALTQDRRK